MDVARPDLASALAARPVERKPVLPPSNPGYQAQSAAEKQASLWRELSTPYATRPDPGSAGVGRSFIDTLKALFIPILEKTFSDPADSRAPHTKIFHPFGSVAKVVFEPAAGSPYSGLFQSGAVGIARLSQATGDGSKIPGIGLKLLVDGRPSVNVHAIPSFDPQTSDDFFLRAPSNVIPPPKGLVLRFLNWVASFVANPLRRPVDALAATNPAGEPVAEPKAPYQILFQPADAHFDPAFHGDFRDGLAQIPSGTVIYRLVARENGSDREVVLGDLRTQSRFVASEYGDRELSFEHAR
jgi:hypothetical protein